jgi:hypothetical protein
MVTKHSAGRDVLHKRERGPEGQRNHSRKGNREERTVADLARLTRVRKENGESFENRAQGRNPKRPLFCMLFEDLADPEDVGVYGMFPAAFIPKILPWLKCLRSELLHVCSGGLPKGEGIRLDIRPEAKPDYVGDGRAMPFEDSSMSGALIDPPYSEHYAKELYGTDYPRPSHLLKEAARVVKPCARIGIVHYIVPNPPEGCRFVRAFGLSMGFGYPTRAVTIYEKDQAGLFTGELGPVSERQARRRRKVGAA